MLAEMIPLKKKETKRLLKQEASEDKFDYLWEGSLYSESLLTQKGLKRVGVCMHTQLLQYCLTLCNPDCSPPDFSVHGILQARILE